MNDFLLPGEEEQMRRASLAPADNASTFLLPGELPNYGAMMDAEAARPQRTTGGVDYGAMMDTEAQAMRTRANQVFRATVSTGVDPDKAAQVRQLAKASGLPEGVADRQRDRVTLELKARELHDAMRSSPILTRQMTDPAFAALASDDVASLSTAERVARSFKRSYIGASVMSGLHSIIGAGATLVDDLNPFTLSERDAATLYKDNPAKLREIRNGSASMFLSRFAASQQQAAQLDMEQISPAAKLDYGHLKYATLDPSEAAYLSPTKMAGDVIQSLPTTAALLLSAYVTRGAGMTAQAEALAAGSTREASRAAGISAAMHTMATTSAVSEGAVGYAQGKNQAREAATAALTAHVKRSPLYQALSQQGYTPEAATALIIAQTAQDAGIAAGLVDASTNLVGGRVLGKIIGGGGELVPRVAKGFATEAVTEGIQSGGEQIGQNLALRQNVDPGQGLFDGVLENIVQGTVVGGLTGGSFAGVFGRQRKATQAENDAQTLAHLSQVAAASKLRGRDAASFEALVDEAAAEGPVTDVYIDANTLAQTLQQSGIDPAALPQSIAEQLPDALTANGDVRISIGEYAAHIAPTNAGEALLPHLRTSPDAMSQAEAQTFMQSGAEEFKAEAANILAPRVGTIESKQSADAVEADLFAQLTAANRFTKDVNSQYAALTATFYRVQATRLGVTPQELYARYPLKIQAQSVDGARVMDQGTSARGQISFADDITKLPSVITLLKNADLSTFLHETGHFNLEALAHMASQPNAPAPIVADMNTVLKSFGVPDLATWQGMSLEQKRQHHETFARSFEQYLFEGKAPSIELQGIFARFRGWLLQVYRQLTALNVQLSDEVRAVFDRLLATDQEILAAEAARGYAPLFASAEQAGMTAQEWAAYQSLGADATHEAVDTLQTRSMRNMQWFANARGRMLSRLQRDASEKRKAVEAEVTAEVRLEPVYAVQRFLRYGELPEGDKVVGAKLDLAALKGMYGEAPAAPWRYLSTGEHGLAGNDGLHPDQVAEMFGFTSGDELVRKILDAAPEAVQIEGLTDQRTLERYGDLASPEAIGKAADAAIHNDLRARVITTELHALTKATGQRQILARAAKEFSAAVIARQKVRDVRPAQHSAAEARAAKAAQKALAAGKLVEAATEKRNELVHTYAAKAAHQALDEIDSGVRYLKRVGESETIDPDYREQIQVLLERYDLRAVTNTAAERRQSLLEWVEAQREQGLEPVIEPALLDEAQRKPYREMTVEEFRGLVDTVKNIEHLGRLKHKLLTARDERDFAARVDEAAQSIDANAKRSLPVKLERNTWLDAVKSGTAEFFAMHRKLASMLREMDGHKDGGVLWELIGRPMNAAGDAEAVMREQATVKLDALFAPLLKAGKLREKLFIPQINASLSREGRLMVALNTGNEGNMQRLMDGDGWSPAQVRAILDTLSKPEMDFVQSVWDYVGTYRERIGAQQKRLTGVEPEWVEPTPVQTRHGSYAGGYLPVKWDTTRSTRSLADEASTAVMDLWRAKRGRPKTRDSFTKGRADKVVNRPLRKDFGVITQHVTEGTHRLAWQDFLTDATRLLRAAPIDSAVREHYGPEVLEAMRNAVEDIAAGEVGAQNAFESGVNYLRTGATIAGLGWRVTTSLLQPLGLTQSMVRIGPRYVARGLAEWLGDAAKMENTAARIYEKSSFMRLRGKTMQREISEIRNKVSGKSSVIEASYFYLIQRMQLIADIPTWLGQYHKAVEHGADEAGAVAQADQAVLDAQGGGQIKDLAAIQRGSPLLKLFTNFYSFFSTTFNLTAESIGRTDFKNPLAIGRLAVDFLLLYSVPAALGTLLKAALHGDENDEDKLLRQLVADQLTYLFGTMVGLREVAGGIQTALGLPGDYAGPASVRVFAELAKLGKQAGQGDVDEALLKAADNVGGILLHYPAGQLNATVDGIVTMAQGRTENPGALLVGSNK
jgi:hypothetical protein